MPRILDLLNAPAMDTGTYESPAGFPSLAERRAEAALAAGADDRP